MQASADDQERARVTIELFMNERHPALNKRTLRHWEKLQGEPIDDFAYRHYLEPGPSDNAMVST